MLFAKSRHIKGFKSMSKERLLKALNESQSVEKEKNFDDARIKKIKKNWMNSEIDFLSQK